jgi:hypothetical protein
MNGEMSEPMFGTLASKTTQTDQGAVHRKGIRVDCWEKSGEAKRHSSLAATVSVNRMASPS